MALWNRQPAVTPDAPRAAFSWAGFRVLLRVCIEQGTHLQLLKAIPGVGVIHDGLIHIHQVAIAWHNKLRDQQAQAELLDDLRAALPQPHLEFHRDMRQLVAEELPQGTERQQALLADMLSQIPQKARTVFMRPEDRSGRTVPDTWRCQTADHLREILPVRLPSLTTGDEVPGRQDWRLRHRLGIGGFGEVWLVEHSDFQMQRACKICLDVELRSRLLAHEARINTLMRSQARVPGVAKLEDASLKSEIPWLMFEYIPGGTLAEWVATWPREPAARTQLALKSLHELAVCAGQFHALAPPIVHRDLKPGNILVDHDQRLKIIDFGISDLFTAAGDPESSKSTALIASLPTPTIVRASWTPGYASPQQRRNAPPDPRDDVHALGILFYQMLMGDMHLSMGRDYRDDLADEGIAPNLIDLVVRCAREKEDLRPRHGTALASEVAVHLSVAVRSANERAADISLSSPPELDSKPANAKSNAASTPPETPATQTRGADAAPLASLYPASGRRESAESPFPGTHSGDTRELLLPGGVKHKQLWCLPGTFLMGSPASEACRSDNEQQVSVTLTKGFWLGKTSVTQAMWTTVMETKPWVEYGDKSYYKVGPDYPAVHIDHTDATAFCDELTQIERIDGRLPTGWKYALPTEAQWEYACRAGTTTVYSYDVGWLGNFAWFDQNSDDIGEKYAHAVGTKKANPWGFFDLHGNVWEWCRDGYDAQLPGGRDPFVSPAGAANRVRRGGSWHDRFVCCRSANRVHSSSTSRHYNLGFRLATVPVE